MRKYISLFSLSLIELLLILAAALIVYITISKNLDFTTFSNWQTLLTGVLALLGAWWTVNTMQKQMHEEKTRADDALYRRSLAYRSKMPDALIEISAYTKGCFKYLHQGAPFLPEKPLNGITILKEAIEFTDNESALIIYELVSFYQKYNSRIAHFLESRDRSKDDLIYDTIMLNCMAIGIFNYARNIEKTIQGSPITREAMLRSIVDLVGFMNWQVNPGLRDDELYLENLIHLRHPQI
ncbi:MAG: hypothetical protein A3J37_05620 [Alphaproteobacteria bacterium RIFCSPHIGHO2_12_FULL_45_9]|nr:MAG: hypothetical protein A3B66_05600 [Alphaproteobacteria bacterium RIFCSPHIGHO2_02_FULL_46_13]OFW97372.1 MAG: hypothetical protein A3J37_05620 [Alphaproteobacteria bacterium RIFCSPHIGHO2_12_FULL_45_9]